MFDNWELFLFFFSVAILYSSVGFGGGSSYLAILALYGLDYQLLRISALLCNIMVVSGGTYLFFKNGHLNWNKTWPLVLFSVPLAYLGGVLRIQENTFFILLGIILILAALLMLYQTSLKDSISQKQQNKSSSVLNGTLGGSIGFLSGMVGIGGGIFLAPVLHLLHWGQAKSIAATASFFILANSISGLMGQLSQYQLSMDWNFVFGLMCCVFLGGQIGSRLGANLLKQVVVKRLTAFLILFVGTRILYKYLPLL